MAEFYNNPDEDMEAECINCGGIFPVQKYLIDEFLGYPECNIDRKEKEEIISALAGATLLSDEELIDLCYKVIEADHLSELDRLQLITILFSSAGIIIKDKRGENVMQIWDAANQGASLRNSINPSI